MECFDALQSTLTGEYSKAKRAEDTPQMIFMIFKRRFLEDIEKDKYFLQ